VAQIESYWFEIKSIHGRRDWIRRSRRERERKGSSVRVRVPARSARVVDAGDDAVLLGTRGDDNGDRRTMASTTVVVARRVGLRQCA
jgi:hypothetical protein